MVGVAEHDLCTDVLQVQRRESALDGGGGGNVLKRGGLYGAVHGDEFTAARGTFLFDEAVRHESFSPYPK